MFGTIPINNNRYKSIFIMHVKSSEEQYASSELTVKTDRQRYGQTDGHFNLYPIFGLWNTKLNKSNEWDVFLTVYLYG